MPINLVIFFLYLLAVACLLHFPSIKKLTKKNLKEIFMYTGALAMIGPTGEVAISHYCRAAFNASLWVYKVTPIYNGDTSIFSFYLWALYGCHLYFLHKKIFHSSLQSKEKFFAFSVAIDAMLCEIFVNLSSIFLMNTFVFYYLSGDIYHLTTLWVAPFYVFAGFVLNRVLAKFSNDPLFFGKMSFCIAFIFVFLH